LSTRSLKKAGNKEEQQGVPACKIFQPFNQFYVPDKNKTW